MSTRFTFILLIFIFSVIMETPGIKKSVFIHEKAMPLFLKGGDEVVIIFHGYLGSPDDVAPLAGELNSRGYTVSVPRLPGHGTSGDDFLTVDGKDWLRKAFDTCAEFNGRYKKVVIAGFSMGGLLAIIAASVFSPDALVLVAPAITNKRRIKIHLSPIMMLFIKKMRRKKKAEAKNDFEAFLKKEYWSFDWPKAAYAILKLQGEAKKRLSTLKCRTFLLLSKSDTTVPVKAGDIIKKRINPGILDEERLQSSKHMIFKGTEKKKAVILISDWIDSALN